MILIFNLNCTRKCPTSSRMYPQFPGAGLLPCSRSAALHGEFTTRAADDAVAAGFCQVVLVVFSLNREIVSDIYIYTDR